jgi:hypothetical protein
MDWINLVQGRDQWRALVNTNESTGSTEFWEILEPEQLVAFQEGFSSMKLVS